MDNPGRVLGGRYRLLEQIGKGGMGSVWRAEHVELGSSCAVKLIDEDLAESMAVRGRFRREAKAAAALISDHVVRTFDYGVDEQTPYIVMELLTGESLDQRLKRVGRLSAHELSDVLAQVALALDRAHEQGLIHRDLKPGNLFIGKADNGRDCVKLLDFGIAKSLRNDDDPAVGPTRTGAMVGSPAYMSPEQLRNAAGIDPASDIWSLGVVAYEALVGQRPFAATTIADLTMRICADPLPVPSSVAQVPQGFDAWFAKACDRNGAARFSTAIELANAFQDLLLTEAAAPAPAPAPDVTSVDVSVTSTSIHEQSTGPLARTANDAPPKRSTRSTWLLASVGLILLATALLRNRTGVTPSRASAADSLQPSGTIHLALRQLPPMPEVFDDAGPRKAELKTEPSPSISANAPSRSSSSAEDSLRRRVRFSNKNAPVPAPSASTRTFVPDGVYGF
jgi:eukaryotic-like serine/threonine-protein kinase